MDGDIDRSRALVRSYVAYRPTNSPLTIAAPSLQGLRLRRIERRQATRPGPSFDEGQVCHQLEYCG